MRIVLVDKECDLTKYGFSQYNNCWFGDKPFNYNGFEISLAFDNGVMKLYVNSTISDKIDIEKIYDEISGEIVKCYDCEKVDKACIFDEFLDFDFVTIIRLLADNIITIEGDEK